MVNEPKKRSITGKLVANVLTEREDDFTYNVTYVANRSIKDLCRIRAAKGSKYTAAEYESMCNDLEETAKEEMYSGSTVELGFMNNSLGVDGPFIGPGATFDPAKEDNHCRYRCRDRKGQLATHPVSKTVLKEVRRNRFPYKLRVGEDEERPGEL